MEDKEKDIGETLKEKTEELMEFYAKEGIDVDNIDFLGKVVDIHKDMCNEKYWKEKLNMRYRGYSEGGSMGGYSEGGSFGRRGVPGSGRRGYSEGGSFGRRGVKGTGRGRYRGEEMMEEMQYHYGNYSEGGSFGDEGEKMEALNNLMESAYDYFEHIFESAGSPEEKKVIQHYLKKFAEL